MSEMRVGKAALVWAMCLLQVRTRHDVSVSQLPFLCRSQPTSRVRRSDPMLCNFLESIANRLVVATNGSPFACYQNNLKQNELLGDSSSCRICQPPSTCCSASETMSTVILTLRDRLRGRQTYPANTKHPGRLSQHPRCQSTPQPCPSC
jgi:hypothetical protein